MKILYTLATMLLLLIVVYLSGPRPEFATFDNEASTNSFRISDLDSLISQREASTAGLKPDNEARIVWYDSIRQTEYAVVYLHGFSASEREGGPIHENFSRRYGCNLLLARLPDHGLAGEESYAEVQPKDWVESAKEAIAMGKSLGRKVIVMATSTGGTLALYLAAADSDINSLILYSPNIDLYDQSSHLLNGPWGIPLAQKMMGEDYREWSANDTIKDYWTTRYRLNGLHALRQLVDVSMVPEVFGQVKQPLFISYYYENDEAQDKVVSIDAIKEMLPQIGTLKAQKRVVVNTTAKTHAIPCDLWNKNWEDVQKDTYAFAEEILGLKAISY